MGRKSKLSPKQWENAANRVTNGETIKAVAKDYGLDESALRRGLKNARALAERIAAADLIVRKNTADLSVLPVPQQRLVMSMAEAIAGAGEHAANGLRYSAMSFHRMSRLAHEHAQKIDDVDPFSVESARIAATHKELQAMANAAAAPLNIFKNNSALSPAPEAPDAALAPRVTFTRAAAPPDA